MPLLAQLLILEVDLDFTEVGSHDNNFFSVRASDGRTGKAPGAKTSPNNMPVSECDVQNLQQVLSAKAQGIKPQTRLDLLKRT